MASCSFHSLLFFSSIEIYEDNDNAKEDEIAAVGGQTATGTNVFSAFYDRLKEIREYHRRHVAALVVDANEGHEALLKEEPQVKFSGEEAYGRYLDLHELYNPYINSKFGKAIEYSAYLDVFSQPHEIPRKLKSTRLKLNLKNNGQKAKLKNEKMRFKKVNMFEISRLLSILTILAQWKNWWNWILKS
ncbi:hypothetical protein M0R45_020639 [Rubus argutus]|uniref:Uncharacterized protein n=1 Tax=Rubus argutus TaxID=59490 RepID=A0AAW1XB40_RUBAR